MSSKSNVQLRMKALAGERGAALVETGVVTILALLMMFVVIDFGRAAYAYHFVSEAAREATRYAAVRGSSWSSLCTTPQQLACQVNAQDQVNAFVQSIVPSGIYVNASATSGHAGYLYVSATWPANNTGCAGSSPANQPGCAALVTVTYDYAFDLPLLNFNVIPISSTSQMVISQ